MGTCLADRQFAFAFSAKTSEEPERLRPADHKLAIDIRDVEKTSEEQESAATRPAPWGVWNF
jgi:hypothetical protein